MFVGIRVIDLERRVSDLDATVGTRVYTIVRICVDPVTHRHTEEEAKVRPELGGMTDRACHNVSQFVKTDEQ